MQTTEAIVSPLVSVIVPVHKTEAYLETCVDSILAQTHTELEIILVDDGSPDRAGAICDAYAERDGRVRVIHQECRGLSGARNSGIDAASGEWLAFVDSDDAVMPTYVEEMLEAALAEKAQMVECLYEEFHGEGAPEALEEADTSTPETPERLVFEGRKVVGLLGATDWDGCWIVMQMTKLFHRSLFEGLRFPEGRLHEDEFLYHRELARAKHLVRIPRRLYLYRQREGSIMATRGIRSICDTVDAYRDRMLFLRDEGEWALAAKAADMTVGAALHFERRMRGLEGWREAAPKIRRLAMQALAMRARLSAHLLVSRTRRS